MNFIFGQTSENNVVTTTHLDTCQTVFCIFSDSFVNSTILVVREPSLQKVVENETLIKRKKYDVMEILVYWC